MNAVRWSDDLPDTWSDADDSLLEDVDDVPVTLEKQRDPTYPHVLREAENPDARLESSRADLLEDAL